MAKNLVLGLILAHLTHIRAAKIFFFKIWLPQSLEIMVSYHHLQYQKKNNDQILRKPSDGRKDKRTDGQTDESDFIGRCRTNVELPISI